MRFVCWITTATNTRSKYVMLSLFHCNNGYTNAPQYYVIRKMTVLFHHHVTVLTKTQLLLWRASLITRNTEAGYDETLGFPVNTSVPFAARHDDVCTSKNQSDQRQTQSHVTPDGRSVVRSFNHLTVELVCASKTTACQSWGAFLKETNILFYKTLPDFQNIAVFWKVPRFRPFVLLVRATCRWRWAWSIYGIILTG